VNIPLDVKESYEHDPDFALHSSRLFRSRWTSHVTTHAFFPEHLSYHCQDLRRAFSEICTKFTSNTVPLSDPSRNRTRPQSFQANFEIGTVISLCRPP
jgi:hypothetical protein